MDHKDLAASVAGIDKVVLKGFRFSGARLISPETLAAELAEFVGVELAASDLFRAAQRVAQRYLRAGGMARVRVVAVVAAEGIAEIEIRELRVGKVRVDLPASTRVEPEWAERFVTAGLAAGMPVPLARIESGVALLNAQPGIAAAVALDAGSAPEEVDITLRIQDRPVLSGHAALDNHGLREVGQDRLRLLLRTGNAFGWAERFAVAVEKTAGSEVLVPSFSVALPVPGMRIGLSAIQADFRALRTGAQLELNGEFRGWRAFLHHPWRDSGALRLNADYELLHTAYRSDSILGELQWRKISGASARVGGRAANGTAVTTMEAEVEYGVADLSANAAALAADAASARIDGAFWRLRWRLGHERRVGPGVVALRANGQWADRNLDATRQFALGGVSEVRAYPTAEALGDGGWIATAEWRQPLAAAVEGRLYCDVGGIKRNAKPWVDQRNRYELAGVGGGLTWRLPESFRFQADLARQLGSNPGRNADGTDNDGRSARWRLWLALSREF